MNNKIILSLIIGMFSLISLKSENLSEFDIYIKVKRDANIYELKSKLKSDFNVELGESILPYRLSLTSKMQNSFQSANNKKTKNILRKEEPLLRTYRIALNSQERLNSCLKKLKYYNELDYFEKVRIPKLLSIGDFNDPLISEQDVLRDIKAFEAWEIGEGDSSIIIGISDSGLDQFHEDINPNLYRFWGEIPSNGIDDDLNGYIDDFQGVSLENQRKATGGGNTTTNVNHGLNVAGIAGAMAKNGKGVVGTGNKCRIFPIKISQGTGSNIVYGYESILYAANNNFDVLNCSWGAIGKPSPIEQSIVDFAIAKGVVIVASAGNTESSDEVEERVLDWYPAGYEGVISVATMNDKENLFVRSSINPGVDIVVQGERNYTTTSNDGYTKSGISGTSFASPVISGAVGVIKYKFPDLNPYEIEQIIRYSGTDVSEFSSEWTQIMPKYFDFQKAMQFDANSILSLRQSNFKFYLNENDSIFVFKKGDEVKLSFDITNYFAALTDVKFTLSIAKEFVPGNIEIINNEANITSINKNETKRVQGFSLRIKENSFQRIILRVDYESKGKKEGFLIPFDNMPDITNFENDFLLISLAQDGKIGYNNTNQDHGFGFVDKKNGNLSFYAGFIGFADTKSFSSTSGDGFNDSDVSLENDFSSSNNEAEYSVNTLPISYQNKVSLSNDSNYRWARFDVRIKSENGYGDFGFGIVGDYDLGIYGNAFINNKTEYFQDGVFSEGAIKAETQIAINEEENIYFGITSISKENNATIQSAGLSSDEAFYITPSSIISSLSSGNSKQYKSTSDIGFVSGVRFLDGLIENQEKNCSFCLALARNKNDLQNYLRNCVLGKTTSVENRDINEKLAYFNGNILKFNFEDNGLFNFQITDLQGRVLMNKEMISLDKLEQIKFSLENGVYFLSLHNSIENYNFKILYIE